MNVKELIHSQQQPQAPNTHKKKPTIRLTTRVTILWAPQLKKLRLVNLTEIGLRHTFKAPCCYFENAPNTYSLFFEQPM